ncbi:MAG: iron-sulfur cluster assembly scaffold protein [Woeseia sp.]
MSTVPDAYSPRVLGHFAQPVHAGDLQARYPVEARGEATEAGGGCQILLTAGTEGNAFREVRHRVLGCPHLIAAAEELCCRAEGQPVDAPALFDRSELMAVLDVPVEKSGRILLLEDAWQALCRALKRSAGRATEATDDQR